MGEKKESGKLDIAWEKKSQRLPMVFTREKAKAVLSRLFGANWLMAILLYGGGLEVKSPADDLQLF
ncbi:MAG: hypothetical protein GWP06_05430 [Actinobacteria bacterium]|nr:hypothetical protein [Actinomycetota bacterium]